MRLSLAALISTITLATAQGGAFVSVGEKFSSGGCTPSSLIFADPIFGSGNVCQPLDRSGTGAAIVSYRTLSVSAGCSGTWLTVLFVYLFVFGYLIWEVKGR